MKTPPGRALYRPFMVTHTHVRNFTCTWATLEQNETGDWKEQSAPYTYKLIQVNVEFKQNVNSVTFLRLRGF